MSKNLAFLPRSAALRLEVNMTLLGTELAIFPLFFVISSCVDALTSDKCKTAWQILCITLLRCREYSKIDLLDLLPLSEVIVKSGGHGLGTFTHLENNHTAVFDGKLGFGEQNIGNFARVSSWFL